MRVRLANVCIGIVLVAVSLVSGDVALADNTAKKTVAEPFWKIRTRVNHTRPVRREGPLREQNIADEEVRQIEAATRSVAPGAVVNIGAVTTGCPCEDGRSCSDQVWVVAYKPEYSRGLMLSRIAETWQIGPLQSWWLRHDEFYGIPEGAESRLQSLSGPQRWDYLQNLYEAFPVCSASGNV